MTGAEELLIPVSLLSPSRTCKMEGSERTKGVGFSGFHCCEAGEEEAVLTDMGETASKSKSYADALDELIWGNKGSKPTGK